MQENFMISRSNASSLVYANALNSANAQAAKSSERISTTLKINRASDDPAGLVKAMGFKTQLGSYTRVLDNLSNTNEVIQNVSSTLTNISSIIDSMSALALKATTETDTTVLAAYQTSFSGLRTDITNLLDDVKVSGSSVMDGSTTTISAQVGIDAGDTRTFTMIDASTSTLGISSLDISSGAAAAITALSTASDTVDSYISTMGAYGNIMDIRTSFTNSMITNKTTAYNNLMSADIAKETANLAVAQIRQTAASAMLAQANTINKDVVSYLLKGTLN
jgi:flagellin